ncbi:MAG: protein kinase [Streptosporangiales bacterium]|nr:protein kinase [Streptosporangiales bacterium]
MATPERMGRYQIREQIGSGGFATVWRGYDERLDNDVAVKVLAENWVRRLDVQDRFLQEARALRRTDSDRVARVYDIDTLGDGRPYFVMSYADRGTLADRLTSDGLPVGQTLWYAAETARAVQVLHDHGMLHRDIKPSNILFRSTATGEQLMIADLGLVKAMAHASGFTVAAGTPGYMAPEQSAVGGDLDQRADVYTLGALTYRMLTGHAPVSPSSGQTPAPPSTLRADIGPDVDTVVMRALEPHRDARWPDARTYADVLGHLSGTSAPSGDPTAMHSDRQPPSPPWSQLAEPTQPGDRRPATRRRTLVTLVAGCGALVLLLVAGVVYFQTRHTTIESKDGAVEVTIPRAWDKGSRSPVVDVDYASDYGTAGDALVLTSGQTTLEDPGITLAADLDLGDDDPQEVMEIYAPDSWPASNCDHVDDMYQPNDRFRSGVVWTYVESCGPKRYVEAMMIGRGGKFGVHVFATADDADQFADVLASIKVDPDKLPKD